MRNLALVCALMNHVAILGDGRIETQGPWSEIKSDLAQIFDNPNPSKHDNELAHPVDARHTGISGRDLAMKDAVADLARTTDNLEVYRTNPVSF